MATLSVKIADFRSKAITKSLALSVESRAAFDDNGYQSEDSKLLLLKIYEIQSFVKLLDTTDRGGLSDKETEMLVDFFSQWLELVKIPFVTYPNMTVIMADQVTVEAGDYATQVSLATEITNRQAADAILEARIDVLEAFDPDTILPAGFFDLLTSDPKAVFNNDARLHTHANKATIDQITDPLLADLVALAAHYSSYNGPNSLHVTTAERIAWNARITAGQLTAALADYALLVHTHSIAQITGLEDVINQINDDIAAMAGSDGREVELQLNGTVLEWKYVGDPTWIALGDLKGDTGDPGEPFTFDVRGETSNRLNAIYDDEDENFSYLEEDTGYLYFRNPGGGPATSTLGWSTGLKFLGDNGWSPIFGLVVVSPIRVVMELVDWVGGEGLKPVLDPGVSPPDPARWYIGPAGLTLTESIAINIMGPIGPAKGPIIQAAGSLAARGTHDDEPADFIYLRTDVSPQTIYIKLSDASGDWSPQLPWQGIQGEIGAPGPPTPGAWISLPTLFDASTGLYPEPPTANGTGPGGMIMRSNIFDVSVGSPETGPDGDVKIPAGCYLRALVSTPGQSDANWRIHMA